MSRNFELLQQTEQSRLLFGSGLGPVRTPDAGRYIFTPRPDSADEEAFRIAQQIFVEDRKGTRRVVLFADVGEDHDASAVCVRTAEAAASMLPGRVCIVEANPRVSFVPGYFGISSQPGLICGLEYGLGESLQPIGATNLWVLPCEKDLQPGTLIQRLPEVRKAILELRAQFDHLLVCGPAVTAAAESTALAQVCDGVILVIEAHQTRRDVAAAACSTLQQANVSVLGAVLNNRQFPIPSRIYDRL